MREISRLIIIIIHLGYAKMKVCDVKRTMLMNVESSKTCSMLCARRSPSACRSSSLRRWQRGQTRRQSTPASNWCWAWTASTTPRASSIACGALRSYWTRTQNTARASSSCRWVYFHFHFIVLKKDNTVHSPK